MQNRQRMMKPATVFRMVAFGFERAGDGGEAARDRAGHLCGVPGRVERERLGPYGPQALANFRIAQAVQRDAEALRVRELAVALPGPAEVGVQLEAVADVDDDQKGRPAVLDRERLGVALGLAAGALHCDGPVLVAAHRRALARLGLEAAEKLQLLGELLVGASLGLHDEGVALVEIDVAGARRAVGIDESDRVFEAVAIARGIARRRLRRLDAQDGSQSHGEWLEVGALGGAGCGPALDEGFDRIV
jgi:hypothetical protein